MRQASALVQFLATFILVGCGAAAVPTASPSQVVQPTQTSAAGVDEGVIIFARSDRDGTPKTLYAMAADGSGQRTLVTDFDCCAWLSPDGRRVAFEEYAADGTRATLGIINTDGTGLRVFEPPDASMNVSPGMWLPDGRVVLTAFNDSDSTKNGVVIADPRAADPLGSLSYVSPRVATPMASSPDGAAILIVVPKGDTNNGPAYIVNLDGSDEHALGTEANNVSVDSFWGNAASWSPDGVHIVFANDNADGRNMFVTTLDGTVTPLGTTLSGAHWSPDGKWLTLDRIFPPTHGVTVMRADGTDETTILPTNGCCPQWSPDGLRVLFQQNNDLWTSAKDGTDQKQLTHDPGEHDWPAWGVMR